ncbi:MAG: hypothetical protein GIW99_08595 [Candidatus Eremiobacteraeota bacterium]|nr:hypothetical protein [Candidatus Eremiobacteraeota bacterium]MBC5827723.1 hypothetical protein [Candidatus Eremiobacteraeota bacterium]
MFTAVLFAIALLPSAPPIASASIGPVEMFRTALDGIASYAITISAHEVSGTAVQDRQYAYEFKSPSQARSEIIAGAGKGTVAIWRGGDKVIGYAKLMPFFKRSFGLHDPSVSSLRGNTVVSADLPSMFSHFTEAGVRTTIRPATLDGAMVDEVTLDRRWTADKDRALAGLDPLTKEVVDLSRQTHLPIRWTGYCGDTIVELYRMSDVRLNGVTERDFR